VLTTLSVIGLAFSLDLLLGEPPTAAHPVAWFGRLVDALDREWSETERGQRYAGIALAVLAPLVPRRYRRRYRPAATTFHPTAGGVAAALVLFLTTSLRSLLELTADVVAATESDLETARERVRGLVGRDTSTLSAGELRSAAVESAAENLADGLVATLLPFAVLAPVSLPAAAAVAAWVKGVNTLDSMLGYPSKPIGTGSARLDDLVMYLPARLAARHDRRCRGRPTRARSRPTAGAGPTVAELRLADGDAGLRTPFGSRNRASTLSTPTPTSRRWRTASEPSPSSAGRPSSPSSSPWCSR